MTNRLSVQIPADVLVEARRALKQAFAELIEHAPIEASPQVLHDAAWAIGRLDYWVDALGLVGPQELA